MIAMNATEVRKEWSAVIDDVVRVRPALIKRTRDRMLLSDVGTILSLLSKYRFTAARFTEDDGSVTLSLNEIDLIENAPTEAEARHLLAESIMEYANEYYEQFALWSSAPNRKDHVPFVLKALLTDDIHILEESIACRNGKS